MKKRLIVLIGVAVAGLGVLVWQNRAPNARQRLLSQADGAAALVERGDLKGAIEQYRALVLSHPGDARLYAGLGHSLLLQSDYAQALQPLETAWGLDPKLPHINCELADVYVHIRERDAALRAMERAKLADPDCPHAQIVAAEQSLRDDDLTNALAGFQKVIRHAPHLALAYQRSGYILQELGRRSEAEAILLQGLRIAPQDPGLNLQLGRVYASLGGGPDTLRKAEKHYLVALETNPNPAEILGSLGKVSKSQGDNQNAKRYWLGALRSNRNESSALYGLGQMLLAENKPKEAAPLLKRYKEVQAFQREISELRSQAVLQRDPKVRLRLARLAVEAGYTDEAERQLSVLLRERPEDPKVRALRGELLLQQQRADEAKLEFRLASALPTR